MKNFLYTTKTKTLVSIIIVLFCILFVSMLCTSFPLDTAFALEPDGSESSPYQISNAEELCDLIRTGAGAPYYGSTPPYVYYEITNDITLNLDSFETVNNPVQYCVIEGNYHTITTNKLFVNNRAAALFPKCENSIFKNIYMRTQNENNTITIDSDAIVEVASLAGVFADSLENCVNFIHFDITANSNGAAVGGLYVAARSRIDNCVNYGDIMLNASNTSSICYVSGLSAQMDYELVINSGNYGDLSIIGADRVYIGGLGARGLNPPVSNSFSICDINIIDCNYYYYGSLIGDAKNSDFEAYINNCYAVTNMTVNSGLTLNYTPYSFYGGERQTSSSVYSALKYNGVNHSLMLGSDPSSTITSIDFATAENFIKNELCSSFNANASAGYMDWLLYEGYPQHKTYYSLTLNKNKNCGTISETTVEGILYGEQIKLNGSSVFIAGKTITTSPNESCDFTHWEGDIGPVNKDCTLTAYFIEKIPTIISSTPETNSGEVAASITVDDGIWEDCRLVTKLIDFNPALSVPSDKTAVNTYNASLFRGDDAIAPTGKITLKVKAPPELLNKNGVQIIMLNNDNSIKTINAKLLDGYVEFTTESLGDFLIVYSPTSTPSLLWLWLLLGALALIAIIVPFAIPHKLTIHITENNAQIVFEFYWLQKIRIDKALRQLIFYKDADLSEQITLNRMQFKNIVCWTKNPYLKSPHCLNCHCKFRYR